MLEFLNCYKLIFESAASQPPSCFYGMTDVSKFKSYPKHQIQITGVPCAIKYEVSNLHCLDSFNNFKQTKTKYCTIFLVVLSRKVQRRQWHPTPVLLPGESMEGGAW